MSLYTIGLRDPGENLDRDTGLPVVAIAGCKVDQSIIGRRDGYNKVIRDQIARHGVPAYSFKPWESVLFNHQEYFDRRAGSKALGRLRTNGPALESDHQRWSMRLVSSDDDTASELKLIRGSDTQTVLTVRKRDAEVDVLVGPNGSEFAVIRYVWNQVFWRYVAVDLRRGLRLRSRFVRVGN
jgi:hypothetical protein